MRNVDISKIDDLINVDSKIKSTDAGFQAHLVFFENLKPENESLALFRDLKKLNEILPTLGLSTSSVFFSLSRAARISVARVWKASSIPSPVLHETSRYDAPYQVASSRASADDIA